MIIGNQEESDASFARQALIETRPRLTRVTVEPFRLTDIPAAVDNYYIAFSNDIFNRYIGSIPGPGRSPSSYRKAYSMLRFASRSATKLMLTIDHGAAILAASFPNRNTFLEKFLEGLLKIFSMPHKLIVMPIEQRKRLEEMEMKAKQSAKDADIEKRVKDWVYVDTLFVAKGNQGSGYGSALMKTLTDQLDSSGYTCWLHALASNEGFYIRHGFQTIVSVTFGQDNPEWHEDPFVMNVMIREPKSGMAEED
ncbi:hypothetical protein CPB83DRAFT_212343 [Crepidotus variabilis]|uniref:N-acetyltransferase domain-containing protein n=1 Tax=Crepidotus variabilis TaxID=179855 RepID=A0A9P6EST2_9AGAR|nr:hypothetical protein CPB83DRAFT_212343 [Crepidotus variabilis]